MLRLGSIIAAVVVLAGCGTAGQAPTPADIDLRALVTALPTPAGFVQSSNVRAADAAALQRIFAQGIESPGAARTYEAIGLEEAQVRSWRADGGATFTVVVSRWGDRQTAARVGGGAAEDIPLSRGARAWTPESLRGARGTRPSSDSPPVTTLSVAVGEVDVFIIATGLVDAAPVERTMKLAVTALGVG